MGVATSDREVVLALYEGFRPGEAASALELLSEDFVGEGREGALRYMRAFEGFMEEVRFEPLQVHEHGERVIVELRLVGRGATSGIEVDQRAVVVHELEDGKIKRMDPYPDLETAS